MSNNKKILVTLLVFSIFSLTVLSNNEGLINRDEKKSIIVNTATASNKKIGWGIKRANNHEQPDLGASNLKVLTENGGIAIGNKDSKKIYLTFDEGYEAGYTSQILQTLKENQVTATFFITAHYLNTQSDLVKQMIEGNHIVR